MNNLQKYYQFQNNQFHHYLMYCPSSYLSFISLNDPSDIIYYNQMKNRIKNFQIQTKLGSGSYGVIYKAFNKTTKEIVVLKQISLTRLSEKAKKNAVNEATIMGKLQHPFIVRYKQSFIQQNNLNILMEYCDSGDLSNYLKMQNKRPLKEEKIWKIFISICLGLQYIHKNKILHRDIKTLNIFMNKNQQIKIGDLGVAKMLTNNQFAQTMVGTPFYLSPELCEQKPYNEKSDIWALGCLLYELCTYRHPFEAQNQASLILRIIRGKYLPISELYSNDLKEMIDLCLERDYKRRPTTSNILSKPKIKEYLKSLKLQSVVEQHMQNIKREKQSISYKEQKKFTHTQIKTDHKRQQQGKRQQLIKRQQILKKQVKVNQIIPQKVSQKESEGRKGSIEYKKQNKNEFIANLQKMVEQSDKNKKIGRQLASQGHIKAQDQFKKEEKIEKIAFKVEQIKKSSQLKKGQEMRKQQKIAMEYNSANPIQSKKHIFDDKKPHIYQGALAFDHPKDPKDPKEIVQQLKSPNLNKPVLLPPKPPNLNLQKQQVTKVKQEKIIHSKVYQSQKNMINPQIIIKSGGFTPSNFDHQSQKAYKQIGLSKEKPKEQRAILSAKRPSLNQQKFLKQQIKQLFEPSPSVNRKSQKVVRYNMLNQRQIKKQEKKQTGKEDINRVSRIRKGGKNQLARNAKNASKMSGISREQLQEVMNLPNKVKDGKYSDSSEGQNDIRYIQAKNTNFALKEINNDLVLQKYEDLMKSEGLKDIQTELQKCRQHEINIQNKVQDENLNQLDEREEQNIIEDIQFSRKYSGKSNQQIQQILQQEDLVNEHELESQENKKFSELQDQRQMTQQYNEQRQSQWSFDQEPQLPMLIEKQSPYFQQNNPYLMDEIQEQSLENKINYLQIKLQENIKREDEINKLMQIKIEECRKFIKNEKIFQEILDFFRKKLNMDDEYTDDDQKQIEGFLKRKGLTDHRKFQNIYKIMHFEMELDNTRTIIQRICKKLNNLEAP